MIMQDIIKAIIYVHSLPYFWTAMLYSTLMAMFFGATIYDGQVPHAKKGVLSVGSYVFMALLVTINYAYNRYPYIKSDVAYQIFIYPVQIVYLSLFWLFGFTFSILMYRKYHRR